MLHLTQAVELLSTRTVELEEALSREASRADLAQSRAAELVVDAEAAGRDAATARRDAPRHGVPGHDIHSVAGTR